MSSDNDFGNETDDYIMDDHSEDEQYYDPESDHLSSSNEEHTYYSHDHEDSYDDAFDHRPDSITDSQDEDAIHQEAEHEHDSDEEESAFRGTFNSQTFLNNLRNVQQGDRQNVNLSEVIPELLNMLGGRRPRDGPMGGRDNRISKLVDNVSNANEDPYIAMESLSELSEHLLMANQIVIDRVFPIERLLKSLIKILTCMVLQDESELQMQACRCMYNLFEVNPESISLAVDMDMIPALQHKLSEINYIDLAEQVLETLEFISRIHGKDILHVGKLSSYLQYLDFFTIHAQRKAISIVSNACARIEPSDFSTIEDVFIILKPVFCNTTDETVLKKTLSVIYSVCGSFKSSYMFETLFTQDVLERLAGIISSKESSSDTKIKCFDCLSVLVGVSPQLSNTLMETIDLTKVFNECLQQYGKTKNTALHECIMFVPKDLLHSVARFITSLFPSGQDTLLTKKSTENEVQLLVTEKLIILIEKLIPLLIEIYMNTIDFSIRHYVSVALIRIVTYMNPDILPKVDKHLLKLIGSALAQNKSTLDTGSSHSLEIGILLAALLSLISSLCDRFGDTFLTELKREGIFDLVNSINGYFEKTNIRSAGEHVIGVNAPKFIKNHNSMSDSEEEEDDDDYDLIGADFDVPNEVKPKKIKFDIFRNLAPEEVSDNISHLCCNLRDLFNKSKVTDNKDLREITLIADSLKYVELNDQSYDNLYDFWKSVDSCIFRDTFTISGFEFITTGLASSLVNHIQKVGENNMISKKAMMDVFGDRLSNLVSILQTALTRVDSFNVVESGLQGEESGMASLGKQMKIHLEYDGDIGQDKILPALSSVMVVIHCVASFRALAEFLKHRATRASFFNSLIPGLNFVRDGEETDDQEYLDFVFSFNGESIEKDETIFGALFKIFSRDKIDIKELWHQPQVIKFKKIKGTSDVIKENTADDSLISSNPYASRTIDRSEKVPAEDIMTILRFLENCLGNKDLFINPKLSAKLNRQLEEPLIVASGILPDWSLYLTADFHFLFPFDTRIFFLQCTSYGYGRLIQFWKTRIGMDKELSSDNPLLQLGRVSRRKLKISRDTMFLTGLKILEKYGSSPSVLEIEYQEEVGTGLGPTLEFYAMISKAFAKKNLNMWLQSGYAPQSDSEQSTYVENLLYPNPIDLSKAESSKILDLFEYLGTFAARSMIDNRILDFRFNRLFFHVAHHLARHGNLTSLFNNIDDGINLVKELDSQVANSLKYVHDNKDNSDVIDQLYLNFVLPGTDIELIENGRSVHVQAFNADEYIRQILSQLMGKGIKSQVESFMRGFSKVFPYKNLLILSPSELIDLFGSVKEDWSPELLYTSMSADHGYTMSSPAIADLISIMSNFSRQEKRLFLQFLTGSPKLPLGGFKALKPKFTVVLKHAEGDLKPDQYLPSVMTCANYLKLPKYSSKEIMHKRIKQAMEEGAGAFLLS
ncbi:hypothetical protein KAFR_0D03380 [Kazachstania africana CBS 2517]|uniref:HECT-type E3 ubiquitin transferase n=1 Tax=Kazachstania africana (strain ATCC 22294 / BCRC 22015 / CBS 2517 / CECT 1963 / NBRC 1671 / NRRL Y-8276) TaxID=1071382 RepID=H2AUD6_KAZAF|nr:hypothetical protein KAFR_0D03380 [Kazachstania africana CBS 2517]CCF57986.1 hypothetical protein KAFR_0D03380 [Kazachstania africana CBS 2517]